MAMLACPYIHIIAEVLLCNLGCSDMLQPRLDWTELNAVLWLCVVLYLLLPGVSAQPDLIQRVRQLAESAMLLT